MLAVLLVDAEAPVSAPQPLGSTCGTRDDQWTRPQLAQRHDQCHLMVQVMESWFLADSRRRLQTLLRSMRFRPQALPGNPRPG